MSEWKYYEKPGISPQNRLSQADIEREELNRQSNLLVEQTHRAFKELTSTLSKEQIRLKELEDKRRNLLAQMLALKADIEKEKEACRLELHETVNEDAISVGSWHVLPQDKIERKPKFSLRSEAGSMVTKETAKRYYDTDKHYNDSDMRYNDTDQRYNGTGKRYNDAGKRYNDTGKRYNDTDKRYNDNDKRYCDTDTPYNDTGKRYNDTDKRYNDNDKRYSDTDTPYNDTGKRYNDTDKRYNDNDKRYCDTDKRYSDTEKRYNDTDKFYSDTDKRYSNTNKRYNDTDKRKSTVELTNDIIDRLLVLIRRDSKDDF